MNNSLALELLESLRGLDACTVANAIETFHERLRFEEMIAIEPSLAPGHFLPSVTFHVSRFTHPVSRFTHH